MQVDKLANGLWTWTASVGGEADAVCLYLESGASVVLVDPLVPPEDQERFLHALDKDVARLGGKVHIALTDRSKRAHTEELVRRYGANVWAPGDTTQAPPGLLALGVRNEDVVAFWILAHAALFTGGATIHMIAGRTA